MSIIGFRSREYSILSNSEGPSSPTQGLPRSGSSSKCFNLYNILVYISIIFNIIFLMNSILREGGLLAARGVFHMYRDSRLDVWCRHPEINHALPPADESAAPANEAIEYHTVTFDSSNRGGFSRYQGIPDDEKNRLWLGLYTSELF
jgi:hypothetical protein